jgi:holliday junction DNA helicase RuvA
MITFLEGVLDEKQPARAVLNVGGVGYELLIPLSSFDRLPEAGARCRLLIHEHIREDAHELYGFASADERSIFQRLIGVSGIGPKLALGALSALSTRELKLAIANGDTARLSSISGIGKKTAGRLVIELRDKISAGEALEAAAGETGAQDARLRDAMMALVSLGHKQLDAQQMLGAILPDITAEMGVEDIVRLGLKVKRS